LQVQKNESEMYFMCKILLWWQEMFMCMP